MREIILDFIQITMRSLVLMTVMLVISLSLITQEFPPDFRRIAKTYEKLQEYHSTATPTVAPTAAGSPASEAGSLSEEAEVQSLSDIYEKRAQIGRSLLDPRTKAPRSSADPIPHTTTPNGELEILKARLLSCEDRLKLYEALDPNDEK